MPHIKCVGDWEDAQLNKLFVQIPGKIITNKINIFKASKLRKKFICYYLINLLIRGDLSVVSTETSKSPM